MPFLKVFGIVCLFSVSSYASTLTVIGPCDSKPTFQSGPLSHLPTVTLGDFTVKALSDAQVPFKGSREGIVSIQNSPSGDDALEVLSDSEMRAYGWCVSVNGKQPSAMPDQVILSDVNSRVIWFYAYALYSAGEWKKFCVPSYRLKSPFVCVKK
jgi:hypothetical protein